MIIYLEIIWYYMEEGKSEVHSKIIGVECKITDSIYRNRIVACMSMTIDGVSVGN
jgi:hypothetical protein